MDVDIPNIGYTFPDSQFEYTRVSTLVFIISKAYPMLDIDFSHIGYQNSHIGFHFTNTINNGFSLKPRILENPILEFAPNIQYALLEKEAITT